MEAWPGGLVYPFLPFGKAHCTSTKFLITMFLITEFLITKFLITKFLITKFLVDKVRNHKIPKRNKVSNVTNFLIKKMFFMQLFLKS